MNAMGDWFKFIRQVVAQYRPLAGGCLQVNYINIFLQATRSPGPLEFVDPRLQTTIASLYIPSVTCHHAFMLHLLLCYDIMSIIMSMRF